MEWAIDVDKIKEMRKNLVRRVTSSMAYNVVQNVQSKMKEGYRFFESSYYLNKVIDSKNEDQYTIKEFFQLVAEHILPPTTLLNLDQEAHPNSNVVGGTQPLSGVFNEVPNSQRPRTD